MEAINQEKKMYEVYCTKCGSLIREKYFPLDNLLNQYFNVGTQEEERSRVIRMLGIGAYYGGVVLPSVPPLLETTADNGTYIFNRPSLEALKKTKSRLHKFTCEDGNLPREELVPVELNIASMVAQFCLNNNSELLYDMLERYYDLEYRDEDCFSDTTLKAWCGQLAKQQGERLGKMAQSGMLEEEVRQNLQTILDFAKAEAERADIRHFSLDRDIRAGWWYKVVNGRKMPYRLAVAGSKGEEYHVTDCCCGECHAALPYEVGAYRQRVIGLLGTQSTGKTTYQVALADAIDRGEATSLICNGVTRHAQVSVQPSMINDPQWAQVKHGPTFFDTQDKGTAANDASAGKKNESGAGPLWLYQHGFPVEKTPDEKGKAAALTFLVNRADGTAESVMYTLADIPGEAFSESLERRKDALYVDRDHKLLKQCDALLMVLSSRQLQKGQNVETEGLGHNTNMIKSPGEILNCYKNFLPDRAVPTAVVMTAADEINGGDLRRSMQLAFDMKHVSPLVWSERKRELLYNAEQMHTISESVKGFIDRRHGGFIHDLQGVLEKKRGSVKLAAFAVSSGTQCAPVDYISSTEEYRSPAYCEARHNSMIAARFGVVAPLLWMLSCDGLIPVGRADTPYNDYPEGVQKKIEQYLRGLRTL